MFLARVEYLTRGGENARECLIKSNVRLPTALRNVSAFKGYKDYLYKTDERESPQEA